MCISNTILASNKPKAHLSIPFEKYGGLVLIEASVEGQDGLFVFDTGTDALIVNRFEFNSNPIQRNQSEMEFETVAGKMTAEHFTFGTFALGEYTVKNTVFGVVFSATYH